MLSIFVNTCGTPVSQIDIFYTAIMTFSIPNEGEGTIFVWILSFTSNCLTINCYTYTIKIQLTTKATNKKNFFSLQHEVKWHFLKGHFSQFGLISTFKQGAK